MYFTMYMCKFHKLLVAAMAAMSFTSAMAQSTLPGSINEAVKGDASATAVMQNIMARTSVRKFKQQPIEDAKIEALLRAGMAAPTSNDMQPWHFIVLKDQKSIEKYAASNKYHAEDIKKTPLFIFVCADTTRMGGWTRQGTLGARLLCRIREHPLGCSCHGLGCLLDHHLPYSKEGRWHLSHLEVACQLDSAQCHHHWLS